MKRVPLVSVIIPTFNRGYCLKETLDSVLSQTFKDFELLIVDDASTDETSSLLEGYPGIRVIRLEQNRGISFARNIGIEQARASLICFLDSDDRWLPEKLAKQVAWMQNHKDCEICYTDEIWIRRGVRVNAMDKHRKYSGRIYKHCLPLCIVSPSSVMIRRTLFDNVGKFDTALPACEDYDLWLRMALEVPIYFLNEFLIVKTGGHEDQLSRKFWGMDRFRVYTLEKILRNNSLRGEDRILTLKTFNNKCEILIQGLSKRDKMEDADCYRNKLKRLGIGINDY